MSNNTFRAPAVPLITHDPFFSVWSFATNLTDDVPRHWDGKRKYMFGLVAVDGILYEFMGKIGAVNDMYYSEYPTLKQTSCQIRPMSTIYTFENEIIDMELTFTSPLLLNDLMLLSRPISYISYKITAKDGKKHDIHVHMGFSAEFCIFTTDQEVFPFRTTYSACFSSGTENMLRRSGDNHHIEWGNFHVIAPDHFLQTTNLLGYQNVLLREYSDPRYPTNYRNMQGEDEQKGPMFYANNERVTVNPTYPTIIARQNYVLEADGCVCDHIALGYDDIKSIQYFGENIDAYWRKDGDDFGMIAYKSLTEYAEIMEKVRVFEDELLAKARKISDKYADIVALNYRQAIAGHKLTWHDGEMQFSSKENFSNGCIATVDVTYPSIPLFLLYAPELVEGMMNPIFKMIDKGLWHYEFAPHDAGQYPLANGQVYGFKSGYRTTHTNALEAQMPVEECGNMILCVAAVCFKKNDMAYFVKHADVLKQWADYLVKIGYNPDNQLCTDDFAGHLAHNVNLSAKGICALGAYAKLLQKLGQSEQAAYYGAKAKEFAAIWEQEAKDEDCYRLAFDQAGTWSLKYNLVWDKLFDLGLFSNEVYDKELSFYKSKLLPYGIPLDNRSDYSKSDWQMWTTRIFNDAEYTNMVVDAMWNFLCSTPDRIPFTDWYFVSKPYARGFQARTVQGGLFINLLDF